MSTETGWDVLRAELTDTMRGQHSAREARHCIYCGKLTKSVYRVCLDHTDLIDLDPGAPAALDEARVPLQRAELAAELAPLALASSSDGFRGRKSRAALEKQTAAVAGSFSSAAAQPCATGRANGDGPAGAAAALDSSETT